MVLGYGALAPGLPAAWQVPANLAAAGVGVLAARRAGASLGELGLEPSAVPAGVRVGLAAAVPIGAVVALGLARPMTRRFFADERAALVSTRELAYHTLVRIPLATALSEELLFRSALLGLGLHLHPRSRAVVASSIAFGLWHVRPALEAHASNPAGAQLANRAGGRSTTVMATIGATALGGAGFAWLRLRSRSVVAPILAHATLNAAALLAGRWVARPGPAKRRGAPASAGR